MIVSSVRKRHRLPSLERASLGAWRDAEGVGGLHVETARARILDERVAHRRDTVGDREGGQAIVLADQLVAGPQLLQLDGVSEPPENAAQPLEELAQPRRPVDRDRNLAPAQRESLQHPGQAEVVIGVVVGEEDLPELDQPDVRPQELALRALGAVEEHALAAAAQQQRGRRPLGGRHRPGGSEKDEVEVHAG